MKNGIFAPMQRDKGVLPADTITSLQEMVAPIKYNLRRSQNRLKDALAKFEVIKEKLPDLWAKDLHYLSKCHEVKSMVLCAELTFKAALMRTESRGFHYREDYPDRDDKNWLKWIIIKQEAGKFIVSHQSIPINNYKIKPFA
jgi:succinate dehydrogenase/fumarate reductase flavoprotein subunit